MRFESSCSLFMRAYEGPHSIFDPYNENDSTKLSTPKHVLTSYLAIHFVYKPIQHCRAVNSVCVVVLPYTFHKAQRETNILQMQLPRLSLYLPWVFTGSRAQTLNIVLYLFCKVSVMISIESFTFRYNLPLQLS